MLGDPNTLIEELLEMRNKIRVKEAELVMIRAKVSNNTLISPQITYNLFLQINIFTTLDRPTSPPEMQYNLSSPSPPSTSPPLEAGHPHKSSAGLVGGREHDFVENEKRRPALCAYCNGMIQRKKKTFYCLP